MIAAYVRFVFALPKKIRFMFLLSGVIFVAGAIEDEFVGGYWYESYGVANLTYAVITMFEESFEMIGVVIFIYALLSYLGRELSDVSLWVFD